MSQTTCVIDARGILELGIGPRVLQNSGIWCQIWVPKGSNSLVFDAHALRAAANPFQQVVITELTLPACWACTHKCMSSQTFD